MKRLRRWAGSRLVTKGARDRTASRGALVFPAHPRGRAGPPQPPIGKITGYSDVDSPQDIDDLLEPGHLHQRVTVDRNAEVVTHGVEEKLRSAPRGAERFPVDPGGIDAADGVAGEIDVQIARDGEQRH